MMLSMAGFALNDSLMKLASEHVSLFQAIFLRGLLSTMLIALLAWHQKAVFISVPVKEMPAILARLIGEIGGTICLLTALFNMPVANAIAILQALPLVIVLLGAVIYGEKVGWRRYMAILVGFCGVLIIVRPGSGDFDEFSLWAIAAVLFIAVRDLSVRRLSAKIPSIFVTLLTSVAVTIVGGIVAPFTEWRDVNPLDLWPLAGAAFFVLGGYLFGIMTMRIGDISFVAPFRYTILIWAIVLGYLVFGDIPDFWTFVGSVIVIGMGVYSFYRERRLQLAG